MNRITALSAALFAVALGGQAFAADLPPAPPPPPRAPAAYIPPPIFTWTGFYLGGNIGYGVGNTNITGNYSGINTSSNPQGMLLGGQIGANYQINSLVLGVEFTGDWANMTNHSAVFGPDINGNSFQATGTFGSEYTLAGRFGWAVDHLLLYGKAGWGFVGNSGAINCTGGCTGTLWTGHNTNNGWMIGAGVEYAITENWTVKAEYNYLQLNNYTASGQILGNNYSIQVNPNGLNQVLIGVNYLFH
jgi:outer membrane immunogenic protein